MKTEDDQVCLIKIASLLPIFNYKRELAKVVGVVAGVKALNDQSSIDQYIKEHPNTRLSRKEILKRVEEGKV